MDPLLADLAGEAFPVHLLSRCLGEFHEVAPRLRPLLERAAAGGGLDPAEQAQLFYGLHILAAGRDARSCRPLLRLLRRPSEVLEDLLGDALDQTLPRILIGLFDGDAAGYCGLAADPAVDDQVRAAMLLALAFLAWEGRVERERLIVLLDSLGRDGRAGAQTWRAWYKAIALLGLRGLAPAVVRAHQDGRLAEDDLAETFWPVLHQAEARPHDAGRFTDHRLGYLRDLVAALDWVAEQRLAFADDGWAMISDAAAGDDGDDDDEDLVGLAD